MPKRPIPDDNASHTGPDGDLERAAFAATLSPLALLLDIMRTKYLDRDYDGAIAAARVAAPYLHPRPTAASLPQSFATGDLGVMSDADLDALTSQD